MTAEDNVKAEDEAAADSGPEDEENKNRKRKERLEQNRVSARESRKRKKTMIEELQRTVITLSRENKDLNDRNEALRRQLMEIGAKYPSVVPLQAIMQGAPTGQVPPADVANTTAVAQAAVGGQVPQAPVPAPAMVSFPPMAFWPQQAVAAAGQQPAQPPQLGAAAPVAVPPQAAAAAVPQQQQNV